MQATEVKYVSKQTEVHAKKEKDKINFCLFGSVAPMVRVTQTQMTAEAGQPADLTCEVIQGNPPPILFWTRQVSDLYTAKYKIKIEKEVFCRLCLFAIVANNNSLV
jgi:hypothetical protein